MRASVVGAETMGRGKFGGGPGPWGNDPCSGWSGREPPFHMPVFVLTVDHVGPRGAVVSGSLRENPPAMSSGFAALRAARPDDVDRVRHLLREYSDSLAIDLSFQDFAVELADPLDFYEVVLLAEDGCVALRRIDDSTCEMKRLYVRQNARGRGLGRRLAEAAIAEARRRGYRRMRLDTLPTMTAALALYELLGFRETEAYRYNPVAGATFLELRL